MNVGGNRNYWAMGLGALGMALSGALMLQNYWRGSEHWETEAEVKMDEVRFERMMHPRGNISGNVFYDEISHFINNVLGADVYEAYVGAKHFVHGFLADVVITPETLMLGAATLATFGWKNSKNAALWPFKKLYESSAHHNGFVNTIYNKGIVPIGKAMWKPVTQIFNTNTPSTIADFIVNKGKWGLLAAAGMLAWIGFKIQDTRHGGEAASLYHPLNFEG